MSVIENCYELDAPPEAVFDLINEVEKTADYSDFLKGVKNIGPDTYRYTVSIAGIELSWDAKVSERKRPERIAWVSESGIPLAGSFTLRPVGNGTLVTFCMTYSITNRFLSMALKPFIPPLVSAVASEIIEHVRQRLLTEK